jgi:hypothetical protein
MIQSCPHCGTSLPKELKSGLSHCNHCNQVFDSSDFNVLLAAAWQIRKDNLSFERLKWQLKLSEEFSIFVYTFVAEHGYTHDEFIRLLKKFNISKDVH